MRRPPLIFVALSYAAGLGSALVAAQQPRAAVFTADQAAAGRAAYQTSCAGCHMPDLGGRNEAPQLAGSNFMSTWRTRSTRDLFEFTESTMPPSGESLPAEQYLNVIAYILQSNGAAAGTERLTPATAVPIGSVATGVAPASSVAQSPAGSSRAPAPRAATIGRP